MRFFNTAGPMIPGDHYQVPPLSRIDLEEVLWLIRQKRYFVLHAPRQTGKTTVLGALADHLNAGGEYRCAYVNVEPAQTARENVRSAMRVILSRLGAEVRHTLGEETVRRLSPTALDSEGPEQALAFVLAEWSASDPRPVVLFIDEIDSLVGDSLVSVLRQLRAGYRDRPRRFPQSVVLCGVRDVRDYRIHVSSGRDPVLGGSAFNIKAVSLRLGDFTETEVRGLLSQHSAATGQEFTAPAAAEIWRLSRGQPWLVNALAYEACFAREGVRNRAQPITASVVEAARERLILRRDTHLDQLAHKLEEPRVRRVIEPLLSGEDAADAVRPDDIQYVRDLGLIGPGRPIEIANPIYREVIPRELTWVAEQMSFPDDPAWYVGSDGRLRTAKLMAAFQQFFREHSEHWMDRFAYREAGPQLLLQAFLQRIVNSGGRIEREYGVGRRRMDLGIVWPLAGPSRSGTSAPGSAQRVVIECKVVRRGLERTIGEGLRQTQAYVDAFGAEEGHLALFDRRPGKSWNERIFRRDEEAGGRPVIVWGM